MNRIRIRSITEAQITLSFDHRSLDGGGAGRLLKRVIELLEEPTNFDFHFWGARETRARPGIICDVSRTICTDSQADDN